MDAHLPPAGSPTLHLLCGLVGSGKSTLARGLEAEGPAVRLTLDEWMMRLHPGLALEDPGYGERATELRGLLAELAAQVLRTGADVVLDWNCWSRQRRAEVIACARRVGAEVVLHRLTTSLEESTRRARARQEAGTAFAHAVDAAGNAYLAGLLEEPREDEGLRLVIHR